MSQDNVSETDRWQRFYQATADSTPHETLLKALALFEAEASPPHPRLALDLGCGAGRDTFELLRRGWRVLAIDGQDAAIEHLLAKVSAQDQNRLQTQINPFDQLTLPQAELVNASFSLPFCAPGYFDRLWEQITASLSASGRFSGHFFGVHDEWANNPQMTFHTLEQVKGFLSSFAIEFFEETDKDGAIATGANKHWHIFSVVARKG